MEWQYNSGGLDYSGGGYIPPSQTSYTSGYTGGTGGGLIPQGNVNGLQYQTTGSIPTSTQEGATQGAYDSPYNKSLSGSGSSGSTSSAYDPQELAYLDTQRDNVQYQLGRTGTALNQGLQNLTNSYNTRTGDANRDQEKALRNLAIQRTDSEDGKSRAIEGVNTNARTLANSVRRILGLASGANSSAYQLAAPEAINRTASEQRGNVLSNYGKNFRDLDLAKDDTESQFERLLRDLATSRQTKEQELRTGIDNEKNRLTELLANIAGERQSLLGGGYDSIRSAQQPFLDQIRARESAIDGYFDRFNKPVLDAKAVNVQTPSLRDYIVDRAAINSNRSAGQSEYAPYRNPFNQDEEEEIRA